MPAAAIASRASAQNSRAVSAHSAASSTVGSAALPGCQSTFSFLARNGLPRKGTYAFPAQHAGSLEALRFTRPEAVGLARTNSEQAVTLRSVALSPWSPHPVPGTEFLS